MKCNQMIFNFVVIQDMSIMTSNSIKEYFYVMYYMLTRKISKIIEFAYKSKTLILFQAYQTYNISNHLHHT